MLLTQGGENVAQSTELIADAVKDLPGNTFCNKVAIYFLRLKRKEKNVTETSNKGL